ncbi:MAG: type III pantothenate kinase [Bacteroidetes bacterium]|jgi:type III pantothenate kinase|nr:type III pantothenate kinase [Bacteroidota bacterium]
MNLIIDIGNTFTKLSVFSDDNEVHTHSTNHLQVKEIRNIIQDFSISNGILSSVQKADNDLLSYLSENINQFIEFTHHTPLPIRNLYQSPETLGKDRLAAVVAANNIFPDQNVLVFDAGTALTIDMINHNNEYIGGNISPGVNIRFKALNAYTANLPLEKPTPHFKQLGTTTPDAVLNGVMNGVLKEIEGYIQEYEQQYNHLNIILTGGDAGFFDNKIKKSIFVVQNLVAQGLNRIITYNATNH